MSLEQLSALAVLHTELSVLQSQINDIVREDLDAVAVAIDAATARQDLIADALESLIRQSVTNPMMTAIQFEEHGDLFDSHFEISLNELGKIAKDLAGDLYNAISHPTFGKVGYLPLSMWMDSLYEYHIRKGLPMTVRQYVTFEGLELSREDRLATEGVSFILSANVVEFGTPTVRYPLGQPLFHPIVIEEALGIVAIIRDSNELLDEFSQ